MIIILAPSKTLDFESAAPPWAEVVSPLFIEDARTIVETLSVMTQDELAKLMHVSVTIAAANHQRFAAWGKTTKPALWAYRGDVYKGMYADKLTKPQVDWAQDHLIIMSGLYGIVRPYDAISPYRLEMKAKLKVDGRKDLYEYWGNRLSDYVEEQSGGIICNLSSDEYARPVIKNARSRIITPVFIDHRPGGKIGPAPIYNKMMRGVMAHWMVENFIDTPDRWHEFTAHGYTYDEVRSTKDAPAFSREKMIPLQF